MDQVETSITCQKVDRKLKRKTKRKKNCIFCRRAINYRRRRRDSSHDASLIWFDCLVFFCSFWFGRFTFLSRHDFRWFAFVVRFTVFFFLRGCHANARMQMSRNRETRLVFLSFSIFFLLGNILGVKTSFRGCRLARGWKKKRKETIEKRSPRRRFYLIELAVPPFNR